MPKWTEELGLPAELMTNPTLNNYEDLESALTGFIETKSKLGRAVPIPGEDAGEDARKEFLQKLQQSAPELILRPGDPDSEREFWAMAGVPEKPEDYTPPEDELTLDADAIDRFREYAQKVGMTKDQFRKGLAELDARTRAQIEEAAQLQEADKQRLKAAWGAAAEQREQAVNALVQKFQDPNNPIEGELNAAGKIMLANIAKAFGQLPQAHGQPTEPANQPLTPGEAREKAEEIRARFAKEGRTIDPQTRKRLLNRLVELQAMQLPAS